MNRRSFFRLLGLGAGAAVTGSLALPSQAESISLNIDGYRLGQIALGVKDWDEMGPDHYLHKIKTIAHWMPESTQQLADFGKLRKLINGRLRTLDR